VYRAHEALGFALGHLCSVAPHISAAIHAGYTRAVRAAVAAAAVGPLTSHVVRDLEAAGEAVAKAHDVTLPKRRRRRK
jgi:hypothetical protein